MRRGTWPVRANHSSGERRAAVVAATSSPRVSAVIRHGPSGVPSKAAGNTSRPDELNDSALGGSACTRGSVATATSAARNAASESPTSTSH